MATVVTNLDQLTADVNAGKIHYDGVAAADCLHTYDAFSCNRSEALGATPQACLDTFKGTVADGGACFRGEECVSRQCDTGLCSSTTMCCPGTCAATVVPVPQGGSCAALGSTCAVGTSCQTGAVGAAPTCQPRAAAGQPCMVNSDCALGLACATPPAGGGHCAAFPIEGQPCGTPPLLGCNSPTDFCDATTGTCVRRIAVGGACPGGLGCVPYARCDATTMKCVARNGVGGACTAQSDCLASLLCTNAVCTARAAPPVCQ
jgi:hypothetical protein